MPDLRLPAVLVAAVLLPIAPAIARDAPPEMAARMEGDMITIGIAGVATPSYEGSDNTRWTAVPAGRARISNMSFTLRGNRFWADLVPDSHGPGFDFQLGPVFNLNLNRTGSAHDARVQALGKRKAAAELGVQAGIAYQGLVTSGFDRLAIGLGYTHDVGSIHKSEVISPSIDYSTPLSAKAFVELNLSANYAGSGYAQTYFGVDPAGSAASGLPVFTARKGWKDWTVGVLAAHSLTGDLTGGLMLVAAGSYRHLLNDFAASPITSIAGSRDQWTGAIGLGYTF